MSEIMEFSVLELEVLADALELFADYETDLVSSLSAAGVHSEQENSLAILDDVQVARAVLARIHGIIGA